MLELIDKEDCTTIKECGTRIVDRKKLDNKKREQAEAYKKKKIRDKDKYVYLIYLDTQLNQQRRIRIYLDSNRGEIVD